MSEFDEIHKRTGAIYEKNAEAWDRHRSRSLLEKPWLDKFIQLLPPGGSVLDVGCGAGEPISSYLALQGMSVTGVDTSQSMIEICRRKLPDQRWHVMDMCELAVDKQFDGIIAWDSFFHLNQDEQRRSLQRFFVHLCSPGALLLTVGHKAGEVLGTVEGETVYHSSLSPQEYKYILGSAGFQNVEMVIKDESCDRTVLLASR